MCVFDLWPLKLLHVHQTIIIIDSAAAAVHCESGWHGSVSMVRGGAPTLDGGACY